MRATVDGAITGRLVSFTADMPIARAVAELLDNDISGAPVIDDAGRLVGIITAKDCFRAALQGSYYEAWSGQVGDFMSREVATLDADTDLVTAAGRFLETNYRRYPVMREGRLIGIVTRMDILRAMRRGGRAA